MGNPASLVELYRRANEERLRGNLGAAQRLYGQCLVINAAEEDEQGRALTLRYLADVELRWGHLAEARRRFSEALAVYEAFSNVDGQVATLRDLSDLATRQGSFAEARRLRLQAGRCQESKLHGRLIPAVEQAAEPDIVWRTSRPTAPRPAPAGPIYRGSRSRAAAVNRDESAGMTSDAATEQESPLQRFPLLEAPEWVLPGGVFEVVVGVQELQDPSLGGTGGFLVPKEGVHLECELLVDGFELVIDAASAKPFHRMLHVTEDDPFPSAAAYRLRPREGADLRDWRTIGVVFRSDDVMLGYAAREVEVRRTPVDRGAAGPALPDTQRREPMDLSGGRPADDPDVTILMQQSDDSSVEGLVCTVTSRFLTEQPEGGELVRLGDAAGSTITGFVKGLDALTNPLQRLAEIEGIGTRLARKLPRAAMQAIRAAGEATDGPPSVLFLTSDLVIPWELAVVDPPLAGQRAAPEGSRLLGAQARVSRWLVTSEPPPTSPPRSQATPVKQVAVVSGDYQTPTYEPLPEAETEAAHVLGIVPSGTPVEARFEPVYALLCGRPAVELIHMAMHATFGADAPASGLVLLADGVETTILDHNQVLSGNLAEQHPFVFLNACKAGQGDLYLGQYAGIAEGLLAIGASAVVAPLWSVDDARARSFAEGFYKRALPSDGNHATDPAEVLRQERATINKAAIDAGTVDLADISVLAYQFFGHPHLAMSRA
ncbi:MAG: CHAT domain-containing protein [Microthrixaceae bacterium]